MSEPNREAVEAAARNRFEREKHPSNKFSWETLLPIVKKELLDRSRAELTAALPHLLAAKDAEIAALRAVATQAVGLCDKVRFGGLPTGLARDGAELRNRLLAALEMSGGVK